MSVYLTYEYRLSVTADLLVTLEALGSRALLRMTARKKTAQALGSRTDVGDYMVGDYMAYWHEVYTAQGLYSPILRLCSASIS